MAVDKILKQELKYALTELTSNMIEKRSFYKFLVDLKKEKEIDTNPNKDSTYAGINESFEKSLEKMEAVISNIYKGNDEKISKLKNAFDKFKTAKPTEYETVCSEVISEINKNKKHLVGVQAGLVKWCKNAVKEIKKAEKPIKIPLFGRIAGAIVGKCLGF